MKLQWRVQPAPTGTWRSFKTRGWPRANYSDGKSAAQIYSVTDEGYRPAQAREGKHGPLRVLIADWRSTPRGGTFIWRYLTGTFATLDDTKHRAEKFLKEHPEFQPKRKSDDRQT